MATLSLRIDTKLLSIGLLLCISLVGCGNERHGSELTGYQVNISGLRMEREENRDDSTKSTSVEYNTKGSIEVTNGQGSKPSGFVTIKIADETGTAYGDTLPKDEFILINAGIGKIEKTFSKTVPDGQSQPIPPKYTISAAGFIPFEPAAIVVGDYPSTDANKTGLPGFQLIVEPIRIVEKNDAFHSKGLLRLKGLDNVPNDPLFVFLNQKTIKHPTAKAPYEDKTALVIFMNGEGTTDVDEFLGLSYEWDKKYDKVPKNAPQAPEYEYSMIGIYRIEPTKLTIK